MQSTELYQIFYKGGKNQFEIILISFAVSPIVMNLCSRPLDTMSERSSVTCIELYAMAQVESVCYRTKTRPLGNIRLQHEACIIMYVNVSRVLLPASLMLVKSPGSLSGQSVASE